MPSASAAETGGQRFGDWTAACRADDYCSATVEADPAGDGGAGGMLRIGRHAAATYWEISLTAPAPSADGRRPFTVAVDAGARETFAPPEEVAAYGAPDDFYFLGRGALGLLDRMVAGGKAEFGFADVGGTARHATFSLDGLGAALIWIDTAQHRIGSERVARTPPVGLRPVQAGPVDPDAADAGATVDELPPALSAQVDADSTCTARNIAPDQVMAADLTDGYRLYIVPCINDPAQSVQKAYLGVDGRFDALSFPQYLPSAGWSASPLLFNAAFDPTTLTIVSSSLHGDGCGMAGRWVWADSPFPPGKAFRLAEFRARPACDGTPGPLPLVYPPAP